MRISALFHVPFEKLGLIEDWISMKGHSLTEYHLYNGQALPEISGFDLLIVMGGSMGANDEREYPWLTGEKELIRQCLAAKKPVLGICLGSQLIASAIGTRVYKGIQPEVGWFPIEFRRMTDVFKDLPEKAVVFHWHSDTYDLPAGALSLGSSEVTPVQGFLYGKNVLALQFHLEIKPENISLMINHAGEDLVPSAFVQPADRLSEGMVNMQESRRILFIFLEYLEAYANIAQ